MACEHQWPLALSRCLLHLSLSHTHTHAHTHTHTKQNVQQQTNKQTNKQLSIARQDNYNFILDDLDAIERDLGRESTMFVWRQVHRILSNVGAYCTNPNTSHRRKEEQEKKTTENRRRETLSLMAVRVSL